MTRSFPKRLRLLARAPIIDTHMPLRESESMTPARRHLTGDGYTLYLHVSVEATLYAGADSLRLVCDQSNRS
jgi:hypothetical protein